MKSRKQEKTLIACKKCGHQNPFSQPYPFHAGFANQGFLYNDAGNLTLVWSSFDEAYEDIVGNKHPWALNEEDRSKLEEMLMLAPSGGHWSFSNPARCLQCGNPIKEPMEKDISYLFYDGSINADYHGDNDVSFSDFIKK